VTEAVLLWNVTVIWGIPRMRLQSPLLSMRSSSRWTQGSLVRVGSLEFAVAFQPLVLLMLPVLLAVAGRQRMPGLIIRSVVHRKFGQKPRWRQRRNQRRRVNGHPADID
jgi:hypothetical protein